MVCFAVLLTPAQILFLDVLFPLELDRVIFVDSDQIVRTDLKQLIDLDLQGAPYGYTPMGDDRPDMEVRSITALSPELLS